MKTRIVTMAAAAMMAIQFTMAQEPAKKFASEDQRVAYATKNLLAALQSANDGLVESALRVSAQMKMSHPGANVEGLVSAMNELWKKNPSGSMRYKAYIAMSVCATPEWYAQDKNVASATDDTFFRAASARMQEQLLSINTK